MNVTERTETAKEVIEWIRKDKKDPGQTSIPPALIKNALEWAANKDNSNILPILALNELAKTNKADSDHQLIKQFATEQVQKKIFHIKDYSPNFQDLAKLFVTNNFDPKIIESNELRYKLAIALVEVNSTAVCATIKSFNLTEKERFEIAKLCTAQANSCLEDFIHDFNIIDQNELIEIAKLRAQHCCLFMLNLEKFGITDQNGLTEIAKVCAQKDLNGLLINFKKFGITEEDKRIEIALLCANQYAYATAYRLDDFDIKDQTTRIKIAYLCAQHDAGFLPFNIKRFGITDQSERIGLVKYCAQREARKIALSIEEFDITDQIALIEIAKYCAQQKDSMLELYIQGFGINDQNARIEIMKLCAQRDIKSTIRNMHNFEIKDANFIREFLAVAFIRSEMVGMYELPKPSTLEERRIFSLFEYAFHSYIKPIDPNKINPDITGQDALFEMAKLFAQKNVTFTIENIEIFGITDKKAIIEIATLCAKSDGRSTAKNIKDFGINDQKILIEIAKLCLRGSSKGTAEHIKQFGFTDQDVLIEIAKLCAQRWGGCPAEHIKQFGITDQIILIEIAKLCARSDSCETAKNIKNFGITDESELIEIAKLCAIENTPDTVKYIQEFGITNRKELVEIAKIFAQKSGGQTAEHIKLFGITDQITLIEIAKICAQSDGRGTAQHIKQFGFTDPMTLTEIAKICAVHHGAGTAEHIKQFGFTDLITLIEIAKLCAQHHASGTADNINQFCFTDQNTLIAIAKICAQSDGGGTARRIKKFGIIDPIPIIEIAKLCAQQCGHAAAKHIKEFGFTDQITLIEIAKICALKSGGGTAKYIKNFGFSDQTTLTEIAKLCATIGNGTAEFIQQFGITDQIALFEIAKQCAKSDCHKTAHFIHNFDIQDRKQLLEIFAITFMESRYILMHLPERLALDNSGKRSLLHLAKDFFENPETITTAKIREFFNGKFKNEIDDMTHENIDITKVHWLMSTFIYSSQLDNVRQEWFQDNGFLRSLMNMQRLDLRTKLTQILIRLAQNGKTIPQMVSEKWDPKDSWKILTSLMYMDLEEQGIERTIIEEIRQVTEKKGSKFQVYTGHNALIEMLLGLSECKLSMHEKNAILRKLLPDCKLDHIQSMTAVFLFGEPKKLMHNLDNVLENLLKEKLSLGEIERLSEKYFGTFGSSRNTTALYIYAAKLTEFNDRQAIDSFRSFVTHVLNGTFREERYNLEKSLHLKQLDAHNKNLLMKWKESLSGTVSSTDQTLANESKQSTREWLDLKLTEGHLPIMEEWKENYIQRYLKGDENAKLALSEAIKTNTRAKQGEFNPLRFQLTLMEYVESDNKSVKEIVAILSRLLKSVKGINQLAFINDLEGQIKTLQESPVVEEGLKVFDSDDPYDLLLSGTEVYGSCQAVDGDPKLNRGILGYLLNGWNRVLKVSTGKDDSFLARCKLQLLWDGEQPVLFRERFYSKGALSEQHKAALNELAKQKAKELGVPLLCKDGEGEFYDKTLHARGGPAPYEYSDGAGPAQLWFEGKYTIDGARYLL